MKTKTIFIVDDNDVNLMVVKSALDSEYKIFALTSAMEMFRLLDKVTPDLILLDIEMPEIDGFQAISILKVKPTTWHIPVIFLSSRTGAEDKSIGLSLGAVDYVTRPYESSNLIERIEKQIHGRALSAAHFRSYR